jgi:sugar/nucleoside kinase (ribokinase family)
MVTLDLIYLSAQLPNPNQKLVASDYTVTAGGPATNAAVSFSYLGNCATIIGAVGTHPITQLIRSDLDHYKITIADLAASNLEPPPISSIIVTETTGDRAVISINAKKIQANRHQLPADIESGVDIILIDGHQMDVGSAIAELAKSKNIPVVIDGGSWKPGFETILPFVDYAICSANFYPPGCSNRQDVLAYLTAMGIPHIAITQGEKPIQYLTSGVSSQLEIPKINAVDTLGAGDVFHGAFCHYILQQSFKDALISSAKIASTSCQFFGTRQWMQSGLEEVG